MPNRTPGYYKEIHERFDKMENQQRESRETIDDVLVRQAEQIKQMHYLLAGTEYESEENGGLCGDVRRLKDDVQKNTTWRIRVMAIGTLLTVGGGVVFGWLMTVIDKLKN